jgi:hypothetical protein
MWELDEDRQYKYEPTYPKSHANQYVWKGVLTPEQLRDIETRVFVIMVSAIGSAAYARAKSFTDYVHTYIDIFHVKLGECIVSKYVKTKDEQELVRIFYQNQKEKQREMSKKYYEDLFKGNTMKLTAADMRGNIG